MKLRSTSFVVTLLCSITFKITTAAVDTSYCRQYTPHGNDDPDYKDSAGRRLLFMGKTWSKAYYITTSRMKVNFAQAALRICTTYNLTLATVQTDCEHGILTNWFRDKFPTNYSAWIAGFRFGNIFGPVWLTTGEPLDVSPYVDEIGGPYAPRGYDPITYPTVNCLSVSGNCPVYAVLETDPCRRETEYKGLKFSYLDCEINEMRVICEGVAVD